MTTKNEGFNAYQTVELDKDVTENQEEKISLEVAKGRVELMVETTDKFGDTNFAYTSLTRDQLWEHVHNCLNAMEGLKK